MKIDYVNVTTQSATYERAVCVRIAESTLPYIVEQTGVSLGNVFHFLVLTIGHWVHARRQLYEEAVGFEEQMKAEFDLFNAINGS